MFRSGRSHLIHRVVQVSCGAVRLRGDNCAKEDPPVPLAAIVGRVSRIWRKGQVLERAEWDRGPSLLGRVRNSIKRRTARLLGGAA